MAKKLNFEEMLDYVNEHSEKIESVEQFLDLISEDCFNEIKERVRNIERCENACNYFVTDFQWVFAYFQDAIEDAVWDNCYLAGAQYCNMLAKWCD